MKVVAAVLLIIALAVAGWAIAGWLIMLGIGILANAAVVPASIGFVDSIWLGLIVTAFAGFSIAGASKN